MKTRCKLITRVLLLAMALLMALSMVACNNGGNKENDETTEATTTGGTQGDKTPTDTTGSTDNKDPDDPLAGEDSPVIPAGLTFGGDEFKMYMRGVDGANISWSTEIYVGREITAEATAVDRAVYSRMTEIEEKYDVLFDAQTEYDGLNKTLVDTSAKTGTDVFDMLVEHGVQIADLTVKNLLYDLDTLPYTDFDQPWWNQEVNETFRTSGGKLFLTCGDISYYSVGMAYAMFFNKEIINNIQGLESPYQKVYNDEWTFEEFETYVMTADNNLNGDDSGDIATDTFGYATSMWRGPVQMFYSTGTRIIERRGDGWKLTIDSNLANKAVADCRDLLFNSGSAYLKQHHVYTDLQQAFMADRVVFFDDHLRAASVFKGSDLDFGMLPWPKYTDEVEEYYTAVDAGTNMYCTLRNTSEENAVMISVMMESLAYRGAKNVLPFYYDTILSYQYLKDDDSINMLNIIHDNLVFDFGYFYGPISTDFRTVVIDPKGGSLHTAVEAAKGVMASRMEAWDALDN